MLPLWSQPMAGFEGGEAAVTIGLGLDGVPGVPHRQPHISIFTSASIAHYHYTKKQETFNYSDKW